jgi:hypothetical protein
VATDLVPTTVTVIPAFFQGQVPCSNNPGAMRSYVVTLTDTTDGRHPFDLPSSPPTPCSQPVAFRYVISYHQYTAAIDGYARTVSELTSSPYSNPSSGSRTMLNKDPDPTIDKTLAAPRWSSVCQAVIASSAENVNMTDCDPLEDLGGEETTTGILVDARGALGLLACAGAGGTVTAFDV